MADEKAGFVLSVNGIVAQRDGMPYVTIHKGAEQIVQLSIAQARSIALDLFRVASYAEADAMILKFFQHMDFPAEAYAALLLEFRQFRFELDTEQVETSQTSPDGFKGKSNA